MKLVDANILLYAVHQQAPQHRRIRPWLEAALSDEEPVGFAWIVLIAFLRLATRPGVFHRPMTANDAIHRVEEWLAQPNARIILEGDDHWQRLKALLLHSGAGNLTTDAHLAALAVAHGASVVSCDADFSRFRNVQWENPLD